MPSRAMKDTRTASAMENSLSSPGTRAGVKRRDKGPPGVFFNNPTAILIVNWWLEHPYRTGQEVSQAVPYIVLGFAFNGDIWVEN